MRGPGDATPPRFPVRWQFRRPDLRDWKSQQTELDADGAAGVDLVLPADLPTGRWTADVGLSGDTGPAAKFFGQVTFQVEEFMPDRMKVALRFDGTTGAKQNDKADGGAPDRYRLGGGGKLTANVQADYLFGRPASDLVSNVVTRIEPVTFQPPQWRGWTFGDSADGRARRGEQAPRPAVGVAAGQDREERGRHVRAGRPRPDRHRRADRYRRPFGAARGGTGAGRSRSRTRKRATPTRTRTPDRGG